MQKYEYNWRKYLQKVQLKCFLHNFLWKIKSNSKCRLNTKWNPIEWLIKAFIWSQFIWLNVFLMPCSSAVIVEMFGKTVLTRPSNMHHFNESQMLSQWTLQLHPTKQPLIQSLYAGMSSEALVYILSVCALKIKSFLCQSLFTQQNRLERITGEWTTPAVAVPIARLK